MKIHELKTLTAQEQGSHITIPYERYIELVEKELAYDPSTLVVRHTNRSTALYGPGKQEQLYIFPENPSYKHIEWIQDAIRTATLVECYHLFESWKVPVERHEEANEKVKEVNKSIIERFTEIISRLKTKL